MTDTRLEKILDCAADLFFKVGFRKTNVEDIARESGVSVGILYGYFENKSCLFSGVLKRLINKDFYNNVTDFPLRQKDFTGLEHEYQSTMARYINEFAAPLRQRREDYTFDLMLGDAFDLIAPLGTANMVLDANPRMCPIIFRSFIKFKVDICSLIEGYLRFYMTTNEVRTLLRPDVSARFILESIYWWGSIDHYKDFDSSKALISRYYIRAICLKALYYGHYRIQE
ncbi:MAG: TetR/AcrR family transcriptional regulator [Oscillospiraceae bacterium]|nr:TetR/AcrR family transcriptional regulator [Oscillospiraceae bacterium]